MSGTKCSFSALSCIDCSAEMDPLATDSKELNGNEKTVVNTEPECKMNKPPNDLEDTPGTNDDDAMQTNDASCDPNMLPNIPSNDPDNTPGTNNDDDPMQTNDASCDPNILPNIPSNNPDDTPGTNNDDDAVQTNDASCDPNKLPSIPSNDPDDTPDIINDDPMEPTKNDASSEPNKLTDDSSNDPNDIPDSTNDNVPMEPTKNISSKPNKLSDNSLKTPEVTPGISSDDSMETRDDASPNVPSNDPDETPDNSSSSSLNKMDNSADGSEDTTDTSYDSVKSALKNAPSEADKRTKTPKDDPEEPVNYPPDSSSSWTRWSPWKTERKKPKILDFSNMPLEEKRKYYKCGNHYVTLDGIELWPDYVKKNHYFFTEQGLVEKDTKFFTDDINTKVSLWQGDITRLEIDAIVNAANKSLLGGGGVDGCIHRAAGKGLVEECRKLNGCETGYAKITSGHKLPAKNVIHTVGPIGEHKHLLKNCYNSCLDLMKEHDLRSMAFCCISTGIYGYPYDAAAEVALATVRLWLDKNKDWDGRIIFCVFLQEDLGIYRLLMPHYFPCTIKTKKEGTDAGEDEPASVEPHQGDSTTKTIPKVMPASDTVGRDVAKSSRSRGRGRGTGKKHTSEETSSSKKTPSTATAGKETGKKHTSEETSSSKKTPSTATTESKEGISMENPTVRKPHQNHSTTKPKSEETSGAVGHDVKKSSHGRGGGRGTGKKHTSEETRPSGKETLLSQAENLKAGRAEAEKTEKEDSGDKHEDSETRSSQPEDGGEDMDTSEGGNEDTTGMEMDEKKLDPTKLEETIMKSKV